MGAADGVTPGPASARHRPGPSGATSSYEYRELTLPRGTTRDAARAVLTEFAEYGRWELARLRLYPDGRRRVWLRRRVIRVTRTA
ncbi:MAG: DUF5703 family protein [Candidatus Nanopelagicales bacterium]